MQYRRELDGLRALAVIPVILFHAGLQSLSGGFVGVDVFFVISGFLITSIIISEKEANRFSLTSFYERRARRILPALFFVMLACLPFAWLWLVPIDLKNFSQGLVAVCGFASNILFWKKTGYFEASAELNPLLHTWSLAVEEQYYVLFPLFIMLTWKLGRRSMVGLLVAIACASLALAHWGALNAPTSTFFLLPARCWEILIGAFTAFYLSQRVHAPRASLAQFGSLAGLAMIVYAVCRFDHETPFPSLYTLVPTVGAALIILFATPTSWAGQLLGSRPFVWIGTISYSAYLWHQPLFAFARNKSPTEPGPLSFAMLVVLALLLAYLSWKYVETPFRDRQRFQRKQIFAYGAACSALFVGIGLTGHVTGGFLNRLTPEQKVIAGYAEYRIDDLYRHHRCFLEAENTSRDFSAECGPTDSGRRSLLIWGDSYAAALSPGLRSLHGNVAQYTASACAPLVETDFIERPHCREMNSFVLQQIARTKPADIYLQANWQMYKKEAVARHIGTTIDAIRAISPDSTITLVGGVPEWIPTLPTVALKNNVGLRGETFLPLHSYQAVNRIDDQLRMAASTSGARFVSALQIFCRAEQCRAVVPYRASSSLTAWDSGHLTEAGSMLLAKEVLASENYATSTGPAILPPSRSSSPVAP
jgi:peptidoglycan/LPS O-acetylase OafA/YrhL